MRTATRSVVCPALSSPDGEALLRKPPGAALSSWLERTPRAVPTGGGTGLSGIEEELGALPSPEGDA